MSPLLERVLADVVGVGKASALAEASLLRQTLREQNENRLDAQERLQVIAHVATGLKEQLEPLPKNKLSRKDLFGCLRGQISMTEDFNAPLADFSEYM
jgi:Protein of unknown function (DUF2281)